MSDVTRIILYTVNALHKVINRNTVKISNACKSKLKEIIHMLAVTASPSFWNLAKNGWMQLLKTWRMLTVQSVLPKIGAILKQQWLIIIWYNFFSNYCFLTVLIGSLSSNFVAIASGWSVTIACFFFQNDCQRNWFWYVILFDEIKRKNLKYFDKK